MSYILNIETATRVCSVALGRDGSLLALREELGNYSHSGVITIFIEQVLNDAGIEVKNLDAVAVSKGPGSYTGLRIGVSTAKGLCYAADKPLIAVDTLKAMAVGFAEIAEKKGIKPDSDTLLCPMIDARRMEVYCAIFDYDVNNLTETSAIIINNDSFADYFNRHRIIFFGDGAGKCREVLGKQPNAFFVDDVYPSAAHIVPLSEKIYREGKFENLAYFEPFYLKDFIAGKPKVKGLR